MCKMRGIQASYLWFHSVPQGFLQKPYHALQMQARFHEILKQEMDQYLFCEITWTELTGKPSTEAHTSTKM